MIKQPLYLVLLLASMLAVLSCEKQTDWDLQSGEEFVVADCIITNELKYQELRLYRSAPELNRQPVGLSNAEVQISDGSYSISFTEDSQDPGRYISIVPFMATAGNTYMLTLAYGNITDTAFAVMTGVTPLESFDIEASDGNFRFVYKPGVQPSMTEVHYDWSSDALYCEQYGACQAAEVFYTLNNIDVSKLFPPDKLHVIFPHKTQIIRRKYSLSEDHQQFIRSLLMETEWRGGLFDTEQGNVPTNFHRDVRGWFAACTVVSDTTFFE